MRYLFDTNVFLWHLGAKEKLNAEALKLLSNPGTEIYLSAASSWEISIKHALGKLVLPKPPAQLVLDEVRQMGFANLDISSLHAFSAGELPVHHKDPFDRLLIAQAQIEGMSLLTADRAFALYDVKIFVCAK